MLSHDDFKQVVRLAPLVSIDLVLRDPSDSILVGRRVNEPARGMLFVPGGVIRKAETLAEAFGRILKAETGLELPFTQARLLGAYDHFYDTNRFGDPSFGTRYVCLGHEVRLTARPELRLDQQHEEFAWLPVPALMNSQEGHEDTKAYFRVT